MKTSVWRKHCGVLNDISFEVQNGNIFGLLGPSGAGKTTLIKLLTGQLKQDRGFAELLGKDTKKLTALEHGQIGAMMDYYGLYDRLSVYDKWCERGEKFSPTRLVFAKSLPLYLGIVSIFFLVCILFQNAAIAMAISVAASLFLTFFHNMLYPGSLEILKYSPMIQLNKIATEPLSGEYGIAVAVARFLFGLCLCVGIEKFKNDLY